MDNILDLIITNGVNLKITRYILLTIHLVLTISIPRISATEFIFFKGQDTLNFVPQDCDSVFIFTEYFAVSAYGKDLGKLDYLDQTIAGDDIPPTLRLRNPIAAILYQGSETETQIPCIQGRMNALCGKSEIIRKYLIRLNLYKGASEKGEIGIRVWEKGESSAPLLVYLNNGTILHHEMQPSDGTSVDYYCSMNIETLSEWFDSIRGVWIRPPQLGTIHVRQEMERLINRGPLIVEIWDGLSWDLLEKAYLGPGLFDDLASTRMAFTLTRNDSLYEDDIIQGLKLNEMSTVANDEGTRKLDDFYKVDVTLFPEVVKSVGLALDMNAFVTMDSMVFEHAFELIHHRPRLLLIRYSGVQRLLQMHDYSNDALIQHLERLWSWHRQILNNFVGSVMIMSTHGIDVRNDSDHLERMDSPTNRGFVFEKMAVPILLHENSPTSP